MNRAVIGHRLLWLATARAVAVDDHGRVILGRCAGTGQWTLPGGIIEPAEQPADTAIGECCEETGIRRHAGTGSTRFPAEGLRPEPAGPGAEGH